MSDNSSESETEDHLANASKGAFADNKNAKELGENKISKPGDSADRQSSRTHNPNRAGEPDEESDSSGDDDRGSVVETPRKNFIASDDKPLPTDLYKIPSTPLKGKYEFIKVIGAGGAGVIYKAKQNPLERIVAIKMVHSHIVSPTSLKRFEQEAKTISNLTHPNLITIHDFGVSEDQQPYMVMDYLEGITLSDYIKENGRLDVEESINLAIQICDGLSHAHSRGILHRDLKPNNIMLLPMESGEYHVKILDFGLAKILVDDEEEGQHLTKTGETVGTPAFMSPEQVMGKKMDQRSDIYSLGCVLYHCLAGSPPFLGETKMETMLMHLNKDPVPVNELLEEQIIDPLLDAIILKLLSKKPKQRFNSLMEVRENLVSALRGDPINLDEIESLKPKKDEDEKKPGALVLWLSKNKTPVLIAIIAILLVIPLANVINNLTKPATIEKVPYSDPGDGLPIELPADATFHTSIQKANANKKDEFSSNGAEISDEAIKYLKDIHNLRTLKLDGSPITDKGLSYLKPFTSIRNLSLVGTKITDAGIDHLAALPKLEGLNLSNTAITDEVFDKLAKLKSLKDINLSRTVVEGKNLDKLSVLKALRRLDLRETRISNRNIANMKILGITELYLNDTDTDDSGAQALAEVKRLRKLDLSNTKITREALPYLGKLQYLADLNLSSTNLDDSCLTNLKKIKGLDRLRINDCTISQATIGQYLREVPQCRVIKLVGEE